MQTVQVKLGNNSYDINIGENLLNDAKLLTKHINTKQVCIVSDETVADLYLEKVVNSLQTIPNIKIVSVLLPKGETNKNQQTLNLIYDKLIDNKFSRDCILIALGGGIVGDITGFAAASYQRGIDFIQIPTTLLSQVDSSVGGKTGVNHPKGKNMIGAFHQPKAVIIDVCVLKTLDKREISAGMAEVIKYGLIGDIDFLQRLNKIAEKVVKLNPQILIEIIKTSCLHKAKVVANDEKEKGERALLNLGHTFGHAVETITNYKTYLHGEAVAIGTMMAAELSKKLGKLSSDDVELIETLFTKSNSPTKLDNSNNIYNSEEIYNAMLLDKKVAAGKLKLIVFEKLGKAIIDNSIDKTDILRAINSKIS